MSLRTCLALVIPVGLFLGLSRGTPSPRPAAADEPRPAPAAAEVDSPYPHTAIGALLKANYGRVPENGDELIRALGRLGRVVQLPVPFSAVNPHSGLTTPRVVITLRPTGVAPDPDEPAEDGGPTLFGLPLGRQPSPLMPRGVLSPLSTAGVTESTTEGRLFLAANMEKNDRGRPQVKNVEFISWNARKKRFDFGVIDCDAWPAELHMLDGVRCFSCHKNKGPMLGQGPWSNTTHNDVVRVAALQALAPKDENGVPTIQVPGVQPGLTGFPTLTPQQREATTFDGVSLVHPEPEACDLAVRQGAQLARNQLIYRAMTRYADGRKALVVLLTAVASPAPLEVANLQILAELNRTFTTNYANFANEIASIRRSTPDVIADFSPSGSMGSLRSTITRQPAAWGGGSSQRVDVQLVWGGSLNTVTDYDTRRSGGETGLPSSRRPSNPKAFVPPPRGVPQKPSTAVSATTLARTIGLTEGDRKFMADQLADLAKQINDPKVTPTTLAKEVFSSPAFTELFKAHEIPDREDFKDRFAASLASVASAHKLAGYALDRKTYASGPNVAGQQEAEVEVVPTTACFRCHDVRGVGKPAFNPIPVLEFDPFDETARAAWVKNNIPRKRAEVLGKFAKRLVTDQDMPPEDSAEHEKYRVKEAASFDAVKGWLEAELKRAKE
jgi:hypothetical protein